MGTHTAPVNRAGSNASDTSVAIAFSWAVGAGTGTNPVNAADFPGGAFPSGTGTIPAGSASATITFQSNPDTTFEQDETGILTLTTTQSGVTVTGSPQPFTITNDDADPGSGSTIVFGPTTTSDTTLLDAGGANYRVEFIYHPNRVAVEVPFGCDSTGAGYSWHQNDDTRGELRIITGGISSNHAAGSGGYQQGSEYTRTFTDGSTIALVVNGNKATLYENTTVVRTWTNTPKGNFTRLVKHAGTTADSVKITRI